MLNFSSLMAGLAAVLGAVRKLLTFRKERKVEPKVRLKIVGELEIEADRAGDVSIMLIDAERYRRRTARLPKPPMRKAA